MTTTPASADEDRKCRCDANQDEDESKPHATWCLAAPASAEPTEADWKAASGFLAARGVIGGRATVADLAEFAAAQRAEIVARYEKVARVLDDSRSIASDEGVRRGYNRGVKYAVRRIREAAPK